MGRPHDTKNEQPLEILSYSWLEKVAEQKIFSLK